MSQFLFRREPRYGFFFARASRDPCTECALAFHPLTSRAQSPTCVFIIPPPPLSSRLSRSLLPQQLLKKGSTGLIVGNARANICLISGAAALHALLFGIQNACDLWLCSLRPAYSRGAIASCGGKGSVRRALPPAFRHASLLPTVPRLLECAHRQARRAVVEVTPRCYGATPGNGSHRRVYMRPACREHTST